MIYGIGVDTASTERVAQSLQKPGFAQKVYSEEERALLKALGEKHRAETAAANFAAKEAFLKAAGTGLGGFALHELAVLRRESGAPYFAPTGRAAAFLREKGLVAHLSLTHEAGLATAFLVLEKSGAAVTYL